MRLTLRSWMVATLASLLLIPIGPAVAEQKGCQHQTCYYALASSAECAQQLQESAAALLVEVSPQDVGTMFMVLPQAGDPVTLTEATHSIDAVFVRGVIRNYGTQPLTSIRIGRIVLDEAGRPQLLVGDSFSFAEAVGTEGHPRFIDSLPSLGSAADLRARDARVVVLYVAEAGFSDGTAWTADPSAVLARIAPLVQER